MSYRAVARQKAKAKMALSFLDQAPYSGCLSARRLRRLAKAAPDSSATGSETSRRAKAFLNEEGKHVELQSVGSQKAIKIVQNPSNTNLFPCFFMRHVMN